MKRIALLGSTGSIGTQALDVVSRDEKQYAGLAWRCWGRRRRPGS